MGEPAPRTTLSLFGDSALYGLPRVVSTIASVFLVPVYTRKFSVAEYGIIENLNVLVVLATGLFSCSLPDAILRYYGIAETPAERRSYLTSALLCTVGLGALAAGVLLLAYPWVAAYLIRRPGADSAVLLSLVAMIVFSNMTLGIGQSALRSRFRRRAYLTTTLGSFVLSVTVTLAALLLGGLGLWSIFLGPAVAYSVFTLYSLGKLRQDVAVSAWDRGRARQQIVYGIAFVPAAMAMLMIRSSDRYFIAAFLPDALHQVGLYSTAEKAMTPLTTIVAAFMTAWGPFAMAAGRQPDAKALYATVFRYYVAVTSLAMIALSGASPVVLRIFTTPAYYPSAVFTPPLGLYLALNGLFYIGSIGLMLTERVRLLVPLTVAAGLLNLALNVVLIPRFGVFGAAWATVLSLVVYNGLMFWAAEAYYRVGYPLGRGVLLFGIAVAASQGALLGAAATVLLLAGQLLLLFLLGFLRVDVLRNRILPLLRGLWQGRLPSA